MANSGILRTISVQNLLMLLSDFGQEFTNVHFSRSDFYTVFDQILHGSLDENFRFPKFKYMRFIIFIKSYAKTAMFNFQALFVVCSGTTMTLATQQINYEVKVL